MKRNVPRPKPNKFLHCFRPVVDIDIDMLESKSVRSKSSVRTVESKEGKKKVAKTMSLDRGCSAIKSAENSSRMPPRQNKTLSKAIKAVVFETILAKRARDRKVYRQDSFGSSNSKRCFSMRCEGSLDFLGGGDLLKIEDIKPNLEKSKSSSSNTSAAISRCSSSISESKRLPTNLSGTKKQSIEKKQSAEMDSSVFNNGVLFLLVSLAITVFWGRFLAILVSSIWLYFSPRRNVPPENAFRRWSEAECRDNNKRVIMEGLIERRSHHHRPPLPAERQRALNC